MIPEGATHKDTRYYYKAEGWYVWLKDKAGKGSWERCQWGALNALDHIRPL